jgi:hypothetical protein
LGKLAQIRIQNATLKDEVREFSVTGYFNQTGRFKILDMMGESRPAHLVEIKQSSTGHRTAKCANCFKDLNAARFRKSATDSRELLFGHFNFLLSVIAPKYTTLIKKSSSRLILKQ